MGRIFLKKISIIILCQVILFAKAAIGAEDPDLLYEQGKFAEAQEAYSALDMDNPRDIRYRYNKGCAAFQSGDLDSASAAFSSVLRRAGDNHILFKSAFNLGNLAFKQNDFGAAIEYFKKAIRYMPENMDARYNMELALREKKKQEEQQEEQSGENSDQGGQPDSGEDKEDKSPESGKGDQSQSDKKQSEGKSDDRQQDQGQNRQQSGREDEQEKSPEDLSGELEASEEMPELNREEMQNQTPASLDEKKAEALLDNLQEDRSRFMQFQVPEDKRKGVGSGKDW